MKNTLKKVSFNGEMTAIHIDFILSEIAYLLSVCC